MQFGVEKCAIMVWKRGNPDSLNNDIIFETQDTIKSLSEKKLLQVSGHTRDT